MVLQETFVIYDCIKYDKGTASEHNDIWTNGTVTALSRDSEYSIISEPSTSDIVVGLSIPSKSIKIEFDMYQIDGGITDFFYQFNQNGSYKNGGALTHLNGSVGSWNHVVIELPSSSGYHTISNGVSTPVQRSMTWDTSSNILFRLWTANDITELRFKNFMVYSTGTPSPAHDYSLSVGGTSIIQTGDTDTITATLTDNGVVVSGETLSYEIKHGSTVIDSGSDTTDSNGEISISYTGTGVGDVSVIVSYGSLLQETYEVQDLIFYSLDGTGLSGTYDTGSDGTYNYITNVSAGAGIPNLNLTEDFEFSFKYYNATPFNPWSSFNALWLVGVDTNNGVLIGCEAEYTRIRIYNRSGGSNNVQQTQTSAFNINEWTNVSIKCINGVWSIAVNGHTISYSKSFTTQIIQMYGSYQNTRITDFKIKAL